MPWIQNVSLMAIVNGTHVEPVNCILIQIIDNDMEFPQPRFWNLFDEIHQYCFLDLEETDINSPGYSYRISNEQAENLANVIRMAFIEEKNIIVHCVAGICRSGGVVEAAEAFGFKAVPTLYRLPNLLVKQKLLKYLGVAIY